jgi:hypothetical protein
MYCFKKEDRYRIAPLFDGWDETLLWPCLQSYMGNIWAEKLGYHFDKEYVTYAITDFR